VAEWLIEVGWLLFKWVTVPILVIGAILVLLVRWANSKPRRRKRF